MPASSRAPGTGGLYGIPCECGDTYVKYSWINSTERNALRLRWDTYEEIGAPEIKDFDDLIDVMEQMQKAPTHRRGRHSLLRHHPEQRF